MKFLLSLLLVAAIGSGAWAQEKEKRGQQKNPEEMATKMTDKMADKLGLTEEQRQQVYESHLALVSTKKANREEMKEAAEQHDNRMKDILTEEQYHEFQQMREKMKDRMKHHRKQDSRRQQDDR